MYGYKYGASQALKSIIFFPLPLKHLFSFAHKLKMPRSRSSRRFQRDRKLNHETYGVVKSVVESVLEEQCDISLSFEVTAPEFVSSASSSVWTVTDGDRAILEEGCSAKKTKQMVPFFSIEGSFQPPTISDEDRTKIHAKYAVLLNEAGLNPDLLELVTHEEVKRRMKQTTVRQDSSVPDDGFDSVTQLTPEMYCNRASLPFKGKPPLSLRKPTDSYEVQRRKRTMPPKHVMQQSQRIWRRLDRISSHQEYLVATPAPMQLMIPVTSSTTQN